MNETPEHCAKRETFEEAGIRIKNTKYGPFTNDIFKKEEKHYITILMISEYKSGKVRIMEPDKCLEWAWFEWDKLPKLLFLPIKNLVKRKFNPLK